MLYRLRFLGLPTAIALVVAFGASGCEGCTAESATIDSSRDLTPLKVATPSPEGPLELWAKASKALVVKPAKTPVKALRYVMPPDGCTLRYQAQSLRTSEIPGTDRPPAGTLSEIHFEMRTTQKGRAIQVKPTSIRIDQVVDGKRTRGKEQLGSTGPTYVTTQGLLLEEDFPPTFLWSTLASYAGLVHHFPTLPRTATPKAEYRWDLRTFKPQHVGQVMRQEKARAGLPKEQRRGGFKPRPMHFGIPIVLREWLDVAGREAMVLTSTWKERALHEGRGTRNASQWVGRHVVVRPGWVLHGVSLGNVTDGVDLTGEERHKGGQARHELRLVEACEGPTVAPFDEK